MAFGSPKKRNKKRNNVLSTYSMVASANNLTQKEEKFLMLIMGTGMMAMGITMLSMIISLVKY